MTLRKLSFTLPSRSVASSLPGIAKHVPALKLIRLPPLPGGKFEISRHGRQAEWQIADDAVKFDINQLLQIGIRPVEMNGIDFVSLVLTFHAPKEPLSYRFITSNAAESDWLIQTAMDIGEMLDRQVENRLQPEATSP